MGSANGNGYTDVVLGSPANNTELRHLRLSVFDDPGNDQTTLLTTQVVQGATLFIRNLSVPATVYTYDVAAVSAPVTTGAGTFIDIFLDNGGRTGSEVSLEALCEISTSFFTPPTTSTWTLNTAANYPTLVSGQFLQEDPTQPQSVNGQSNFSIISRTSIFGNDQSGYLDTVADNAAPLSTVFIYFKSTQDRFDRQEVLTGYFYSDTDTYVFAGGTENVIGTGSLDGAFWDVSVAGVQYVNPLTGFTGTFTNGDGNTVTVTNGIITGIA